MLLTVVSFILTIAVFAIFAILVYIVSMRISIRLFRKRLLF